MNTPMKTHMPRSVDPHFMEFPIQETFVIMVFVSVNIRKHFCTSSCRPAPKRSDCLETHVETVLPYQVANSSQS